MAKFNFFRSEKKEELKPNEIQQEIDNKVKRIEKLENEIDKADDFLNVIVDSQKKEVKNRMVNIFRDSKNGFLSIFSTTFFL